MGVQPSNEIFLSGQNKKTARVSSRIATKPSLEGGKKRDRRKQQQQQLMPSPSRARSTHYTRTRSWHLGETAHNGSPRIGAHRPTGESSLTLPSQTARPCPTTFSPGHCCSVLWGMTLCHLAESTRDEKNVTAWTLELRPILTERYHLTHTIHVPFCGNFPFIVTKIDFFYCSSIGSFRSWDSSSSATATERESRHWEIVQTIVTAF